MREMSGSASIFRIIPSKTELSISETGGDTENLRCYCLVMKKPALSDVYKAALNARGETSASLAKRTGISSSSLYAIENAETSRPRRSTLIEIARALRVTPTPFLTAAGYVNARSRVLEAVLAESAAGLERLKEDKRRAIEEDVRESAEEQKNAGEAPITNPRVQHLDSEIRDAEINYVRLRLQLAEVLEYEHSTRFGLLEQLGQHTSEGVEKELTPQSVGDQNSHSDSTIQSVDGSDGSAFVLALEFSVSAGPGVLEELMRSRKGLRPSIPHETLRVDRSEFLATYREAPEDTVVVRVKGDSMEKPDGSGIHHGDRVVVSFGDRDIGNPGIFVLYDGWSTVMKRVYIDYDRSSRDEVFVIVSSDNPAYPSRTMSADEIRITGRVVGRLKPDIIRAPH